MIIVIDDSIIANCALYRNLSFPLSLCRSVSRHSASSSSCSPPCLFLPPQHMLACSHSLAGTVSILRGFSVSISQQPPPRGSVLPTLLQREELWWSAFPLCLSCCSAPGFTPACKTNLWPSPFPRQPYPLSQNRRKQKNAL